LLKINDKEIISHGIVLETVLPPEAIGYRNEWASLDGLPARFVSSYHQAYIRKVGLRVFGETKREANKLRSILIGRLVTESVAKIQFRHEPTYELGKLEELNTGAWEAGSLPIEAVFLCPYGVSFGEDHEEAIGAVTVTGTAKTPPIFTVTPTGENLEVSNGTEHIRLENITTGEIVIDCNKRTITQGSTNIREKLTIESRYFDLVPGENTLQITGGTGKVRWTDRWI
jgi:phage-related protein